MLGVDAMLCSVTRQNLIREEFKKVPTTKAIVKEYDDETNRLLFPSTSQEQRNGSHQMSWKKQSKEMMTAKARQGSSMDV